MLTKRVVQASKTFFGMHACLIVSPYDHKTAILNSMHVDSFAENMKSRTSEVASTIVSVQYTIKVKVYQTVAHT